MARLEVERDRPAEPSPEDLAALGAAIFDAIYPDPRPMQTQEQFHRSTHEDIPDLDDEQLDSERMLARLRHAIARRPSAWLLERERRLNGEALRRQHRPQR